METMVQTPLRSDSMIRESVISELKWDPKLATSADVAVAVKEGVVTLSGFVHSYFEKDAAEKAAKRVYGAVHRIEYLCSSLYRSRSSLSSRFEYVLQVSPRNRSELIRRR